MRLSSVCLVTAPAPPPQVSVKYEGCDMVIGVSASEPAFTCAWVRLIVVKPLGPDWCRRDLKQEGC